MRQHFPKGTIPGKNPEKRRSGSQAISSLVEYLPDMCKALGSIPSTARKIKEYILKEADLSSNKFENRFPSPKRVTVHFGTVSFQ
jgi:hypothetical protein